MDLPLNLIFKNFQLLFSVLISSIGFKLFSVILIRFSSGRIVGKDLSLVKSVLFACAVFDSFQKICKYIKGSGKHLADTWNSNSDHLAAKRGFFSFFFLLPFRNPAVISFWFWHCLVLSKVVVKAAGLCRVICWAVSADTVTKEAVQNPCWFPELGSLFGLPAKTVRTVTLASTQLVQMQQFWAWNDPKKKKPALPGGCQKSDACSFYHFLNVSLMDATASLA